MAHVKCDSLYRFGSVITKSNPCIFNQTLVFFLWHIKEGEKPKQEDFIPSFKFNAVELKIYEKIQLKDFKDAWA